MYVLEDDYGKRYKGMTNNIERRLMEHKSGKTITTRKMHNVRLVYKEVCKNREDARKRELYLKTAAGRRFIKKIMGDYPPERTDVRYGRG